MELKNLRSSPPSRSVADVEEAAGLGPIHDLVRVGPTGGGVRLRGGAEGGDGEADEDGERGPAALRTTKDAPAARRRLLNDGVIASAEEEERGLGREEEERVMVVWGFFFFKLMKFLMVQFIFVKLLKI